ncbi:MAG: hypothetical protein OET44_02330 [Gammaproteobacteria bacterium]|nr:hypothetical protein [Gammaproteobacteria bacterium]
MSQQLYFYASVLVLGALLFFPASKLIWVLSVRRLERKTGGGLSEDERMGQRNRARLLALVLVLIFSLLFNISMLGLPQNG